MIRGVIFDIDGVLEYQSAVYPYAVETIGRLRSRGLTLRFLTNSTLTSRASCAITLRDKGFTVFDNEIFTASSIAATYLKLLHLGPAGSCWTERAVMNLSVLSKITTTQNILSLEITVLVSTFIISVKLCDYFSMALN